MTAAPQETVETAPRIKMVLAPNYRWFTEWCYRNSINPRDNKIAVYLFDDRRLAGYDPDKIEFVDLGFSEHGSITTQEKLWSIVQMYRALGASYTIGN